MQTSTTSTVQDTAIDVLIVTAVIEECDAVRKVSAGATPGTDWVEWPTHTKMELFVRSFETEEGPLRIGVTRAFGMGREHAVTAAAPLLGQYPSIRCLAMCGVCAGRRGDVNLGDVIIADRTWPYDAGKLIVTTDDQGRRIERFQGDMDLYRIHPSEWKQRAERFQPDPMAPWIAERPRSYEAQANWLLERLVKGEDPVGHPDRITKCPDYEPVLKQLWKVKRLKDGERKLTAAGTKHIRRLMTLQPDGLRDDDPFKVVVGPLASGAPVVQDETIFDRLSDSLAMRKVLGLEMEISAILMLAYLQRLNYAIVMKGVMDHADIFKSDNMKAFAACASAECLIAFLRQNMPPIADLESKNKGVAGDRSTDRIALVSEDVDIYQAAREERGQETIRTQGNFSPGKVGQNYSVGVSNGHTEDAGGSNAPCPKPQQTPKQTQDIFTEGHYSPGMVGGSYTVQAQPACPDQSAASGKNSDVTQADNSAKKASKSIRTKGNYSPGEVGGDYKIEQ